MPPDQALLYTDGASRGNPGEAAICYRILDRARAIIAERAECIGRATNNQAEYRAILAGLSACAALSIPRIRCHSDSELMIRQLRGEYKVKNRTLRPLWTQARGLAAGFAEISFAHVPRSDPEIVRADFLANRALDGSSS